MSNVLNVTIDLKDLYEYDYEGICDETVLAEELKSEVESNIIKRIETTEFVKIREELAEKISVDANEKINELIEKFSNEFETLEIQELNSWGSPKGEKKTIKQLFREKLESSFSYSEIEKMIDRKLERITNSYNNVLDKTVDRKVKEVLSEYLEKITIESIKHQINKM